MIEPIRVEYKLKGAPGEGISRVKFSPTNPTLLAVSSWDTSIRFYDVKSNVITHKYTHNNQPVLDFTFGPDGSTVFSGGLDGQVMGYDLNSEVARTIGSHADTVRVVDYSKDRSILVTGSWDSNVSLWDPRTPALIGTHSQRDEVYTLSVKDEVLIVGTSCNGVILHWDLRNMREPLEERESLLKYQTRSLQLFPNKGGYVQSSIEGRVAVEYFGHNSQNKKCVFKCHRIIEEGVVNIYPVNAISFHDEHGTFGTGGSDGFVNIWDGSKCLYQFERYPTSIASLSFNCFGTILAIGCSYLYEFDEHPDPIPDNTIFIRRVTEQETKPN